MSNENGNDVIVQIVCEGGRFSVIPCPIRVKDGDTVKFKLKQGTNTAPCRLSFKRSLWDNLITPRRLELNNEACREQITITSGINDVQGDFDIKVLGGSINLTKMATPTMIIEGDGGFHGNENNP